MLKFRAFKKVKLKIKSKVGRKSKSALVFTNA